MKTTTNFSIRTLLFTFLLLTTVQISAQTYTNDDDLEDAVHASTDGGTFVLKNGTYDSFRLTIEKVATSAKPIIIKAESIGGVTLTGTSRVVFEKSAYITFEGFVFDATNAGTLVKLEGSNHIRITRNVFEQTTTNSAKWVYIGGVWDDKTYPFQFPSHNNRIDHNIFQNKSTPGHFITVDGSTDDATDTGYQSQYDRIDHNYFKNNSPRAVNEQESIRIGWSEMSQSSGYTIVEYNLFEDCDGDPEIVSVKSCDNTIRHNTFLKSYGTLSLRHGNRNRVEGNYFFGGGKAIGTSPDDATLYTGGIRIYGTDHVIINNYMQDLNGTRWDAPITLTQGDAIDGESSSLSKHFRAEDVIIAYNTLVNNSHGIEIGFDNNGKYSKDLSNILIANNLITGSENSLVEIKDSNDQGSNITWKNNLMYPTGTATTIAGATSTSFTTDMVVNENPNLTFDNTLGTWKTTSTTPVYADGVITETVNKDIHGHDRPANSNPGADHYSLESIRYKPMTPDTVGPDAFEADDTTETLYVSSIADYTAAGATKTVNVTSNLSWTITDDKDWISTSITSGSNSGSFDITVTENTEFTERTGKVTITAGSLTRTINITQEAADPKTGLTLINDASSNDNVSVNYVFAEEVTSTKNNIAAHSLDKSFSTQWSGFGYGGEIIYDLGGSFDLKLVDYATTSGKTYELEIWVSSTGTASEDFTNAFPESGNLVSNTDASFKSFILPTEAVNTRYVKIIGHGQPSRPSEWNTITEIEFYKTTTLSVNDNELNNSIVIYPNPASETLRIKNLKNTIKSIQLFSILGKEVLHKTIESTQSEIEVNISFLSKGNYILKLTDEKNAVKSKMIIITE